MKSFDNTGSYLGETDAFEILGRHINKTQFHAYTSPRKNGIERTNPAPAINREVKECPECGSNNLIRDFGKAELSCADCGLVIDENLQLSHPSAVKNSAVHDPRDLPLKMGNIESIINNLRIPGETKDILKWDLENEWRDWQSRHWISYGRVSVQAQLELWCLWRVTSKHNEKLLGLLRDLFCWGEIRNLYKKEIAELKKRETEKTKKHRKKDGGEGKDDYMGVFKLLSEGGKIWHKKRAKEEGVKPSVMLYDEYWYFILNVDKLFDSLQERIPERMATDILERAYKECREGWNKLYDAAGKHQSEHQYMNMNYFHILTLFYAIEKFSRKKYEAQILLKTREELATIWDIPLRTLKRKMKFLKDL